MSLSKIILCLNILVVISFSGCRNAQNPIVNPSSALIVDSLNLNFGSNQSLEASTQLEVFFIKQQQRSWLGSYEINKLNEILNLLNIEETSNYDVLSYYSYNLIPQEVVRDLIEIAEKTELILLVLKKKDKIIAQKIIAITPKKVRIIRVELIGKEIKITVN